MKKGKNSRTNKEQLTYMILTGFSCFFLLNSQVDSPPFAATVVPAAAIYYYQEDPLFQLLGLTYMYEHKLDETLRV